MFGALLNPAVIWVLIPIAAIVTGFLISWKKLDLEHDRRDISNEHFRVLKSEIASLRERIEALETGNATSSNRNKTTINSDSHPDSSEMDDAPQQRLRNMLR